MKVTLKYGANQWDNLEVPDNGTVEDFLDEVSSLFSIPDDVEARVGGNRVDMDYTLRNGDVVEFYKASGSKG